MCAAAICKITLYSQVSFIFLLNEFPAIISNDSCCAAPLCGGRAVCVAGLDRGRHADLLFSGSGVWCANRLLQLQQIQQQLLQVSRESCRAERAQTQFLTLHRWIQSPLMHVWSEWCCVTETPSSPAPSTLWPASSLASSYSPSWVTCHTNTTWL